MERDRNKTKAQLIEELDSLRRRLEETEALGLKRAHQEEQGQSNAAIEHPPAAFHMALKAANSGFYDLDLINNIATLSAEIEELYGVRQGELNGKTLKAWEECVLPEDLPQGLIDLQRAIDNGYAISSAFRIRRRDNGEIRWIEARGQIIYNAEHKPSHIIGINTDITERKQAEEALKESEERFLTAFYSCPAGLTIASLPEGRWVDVNDTFLRLTEYTREEVIGRTSVELNMFPQPERRSEVLQSFLKNGTTQDTELTIVTKTGKLITVLSSSDTITLGGQPHALSTIVDITERRRAEDQLRLAEEKFSRAFQVGPAGMTITRIADGTFIEANDSFLRMFEFNSDELIGHTSTELNMWTIEERRRLIELQLKSGGLQNHELTARSKHGRKIVILFSSKEMKIAGEPCLVTLMVDITESKRAEEALRKSEEEWRSLVENTPDIVTLIDRDRKIQFISHTVAGLNANDVIGKSIFAYIQPEHHQLAEDSINEVFLTGRQAFYQVRGAGPGGTVSWYETRLGALKSNGEITGVILISTDITARKLAEETLRKNEEKFRTLVENIPQKIFHKDADSVYISCNTLYARDLLITPEEIRGKTDFDFFPKELAEKYREDDKRIIQSGKLEDIEERYVQNGQENVVHTIKTPVRDDSGNVTGIIGIFHDVTERWRLQGQLIAQDRMASIGQLIAGVAHEMNNPLTSVIGFSDLLLERKDLPDGAREDMGTVNREARRTAGIVRALLTFARGQKAAKELVDIHSIIQSVLQLRAYEQKVNNIEIETRFSPDLPRIMGDGGQLQQVVINIIINAEQAMLEAHNRGKLTIATERRGDIARISFTDDGPGISPENMRRLFTPFFTTKEVGKGTGLGLSICHGIVTEHGGRIYAESEPGQGTTFFIELPPGKPAQG